MSFSSFFHACHKQAALQGKSFPELYKGRTLPESGIFQRVLEGCSKYKQKHDTVIMECTIIPSLGNFNATDYIKSSEKCSLISLTTGFSKLCNHRPPGLYGAWSEKQSLDKKRTRRRWGSGSIRQDGQRLHGSNVKTPEWGGILPPSGSVT